MAKVTHVEYIDDLDQEPVDLDDLVIKTFTVDGVDYRAELRVENADEFDNDLDRWIAAATRVGGRKNVRRPKPAPADDEPKTGTAAVREWALRKGYDVSSRGRLPASIFEAYNDAH